MSTIQPLREEARREVRSPKKGRWRHSLLGSGAAALLVATLVAAGAGFVASRLGGPARTGRIEPGVDTSTPPPFAGFEANTGQADPSVRFLARTSMASLFLGEREISVLPTGLTQVVTIGLRDANAGAEPEGVEPLPGKVNILRGNDPQRWVRNIPTFDRVEYPSITPGVDMVVHAGAGFVKYDLVLAPGADPNAVVVQVSGVGGMHVDGAGDLVGKVGGTTIRQPRPAVYQQVDGGRRPLVASYRLVDHGGVGFRIAGADPLRPVVIDPSVSFSYTLPTGLSARSTAIDRSGNVYVAGTTTSSVAGAARFGVGGGIDVFVTKLDPSGSHPVYTTIFGSSGNEARDVTAARTDDPVGLAIDATGRAVITGATFGDDFPVTANAFQSQLSCAVTYDRCRSDAFVTMLSSDGQSLGYSTYLGGAPGPDAGNRVALDPSGAIYVAGSSFQAATFPTRTPTGAPAFRQACDCRVYVSGFVAKIDPTKSGDASLVYATLLTEDNVRDPNQPASGTSIFGLQVDAQGFAYVTGSAGSGYPTTPGAFDPTIDTSGRDVGFVTKLNQDGSGLIYSTRLGRGGGYLEGSALAIDGVGNAYVTGTMILENLQFPTAQPIQAQPKGGSTEAFVTKVSPDGASLGFSTFLGGSGDDAGTGIALDPDGNIYVAGSTTSTDFPSLNPLSGQSGGAFLTRISPQGDRWLSSTTLNGTGAVGLALDGAGSQYVLQGGAVIKIANLPVIQSVQPSAGPTAGGTPITLTGSGFKGATSVSFGGDPPMACGGSSTACVADAQNPDGVLRVMAPAHREGTLDLKVTSPAGPSKPATAARFTYRPPVITNVDVVRGPAVGGTAVTLTGTDLQASAVLFGSSGATNVTVTPDGTQVKATTPLHPAGPASISAVTPPGSVAAAATAFTYVPTVTGISPPSGSVQGGDKISIAGAGFTGATAVRFGSEPPVVPVVADDTHMTLTTPAHATSESVAVVVTAASLDSMPIPAGANLFHYDPAPAKQATGGTAGAANNNQNTKDPVAPPSGGTAGGNGPATAANPGTATAQGSAPEGAGSGATAAAPPGPGANPTPAAAFSPPPASPSGAPVPGVQAAPPPPAAAPLPAASPTPAAAPIPPAPPPAPTPAGQPVASPPPPPSPGAPTPAAQGSGAPGAVPGAPPGQVEKGAPRYAMAAGDQTVGVVMAFAAGGMMLAVAIGFACYNRRRDEDRPAYAYAGGRRLKR